MCMHPRPGQPPMYFTPGVDTHEGRQREMEKGRQVYVCVAVCAVGGGRVVRIANELPNLRLTSPPPPPPPHPPGAACTCPSI